jgi:hypothetical protein
MDQADILIKLSYRLILALLQTGVNIDSMVTSAKLAGKLSDVNTHTARVFCSQRSDRIGMDA